MLRQCNNIRWIGTSTKNGIEHIIQLGEILPTYYTDEYYIKN